MRINLDRIPHDEVAAVHIPDRECGQIFLDAMREKYPSRVSSWSFPHFDDDNHNFNDGVCYIPHFEQRIGHMTHWSIRAAKRGGYRIVEWTDICEDLLCQVPELPICLGDMPLKSLFG